MIVNAALDKSAFYPAQQPDYQQPLSSFGIVKCGNLAQASQPDPRAPRNAAQPLPSFESRVLDASGAPAAAPAPQPQPPPLTASERAANAIAKVAQEVSELEPQVFSASPFPPDHKSSLPNTRRNWHFVKCSRTHSFDEQIS